VGGQYHLSEATLYLATAAKSNSAGAYWKALKYVQKNGYQPPPIYLRDKNTLLKEEAAQNATYKYPHDHPSGWVAQRYLPSGVPGGWYQPKGYGYEERIVETQAKRKSRTEK